MQMPSTEIELTSLGVWMVESDEGMRLFPEKKTLQARQMLRSGTAPAPNYAEARGAESRTEIIHRLGIVQKELNETSVWLRILSKTVAENQELCRIIGAS